MSRWRAGSIGLVLTSAVLGTAIALAGSRLSVPVAAGVVGVIIAGVVGAPAIYRRTANLTRAMSGWHLLWVMLFLSGLTFRVRGVSQAQETPLDSAALYRVALVVLAGAVVVWMALSSRHLSLSASLRGGIGPLAAYAVMGIALAPWSVFPAWSAYKSAEYLVDLMMCGVLVVALRDRDQLLALANVTYLLQGLLVASVLAGVVFAPSQAILYGVGSLGFQLQGVYPAISTNGVGDLGAVLAIVATARLLTRGRSRFYQVLLGFGLAVLIVSQSRTPLAGYVVATLLMLLATRDLSKLTVAGMTVVGISLTPVWDSFVEFVQRGQSTEMIVSLSGRVTLFWASAWSVFRDHILTGVGAYAGGRFMVVAGTGDATAVSSASSVDSAFVEVAVSSGVIGLALLLAALGRTWLGIRRSLLLTVGSDRGLAVEMLGILTLESLRAFFSSGPIIWHPATRFLLVLVFVEWTMRRLMSDHAIATREPGFVG